MKTKSTVAGRAQPDLVEDLDPGELSDGRRVEDAHVSGADFTGRTLNGLEAIRSIIEGVSFAQSEVRSTRLRDMRFVRCDFSNASLRGLEATRVEFIDCRLTGFKAIECRIQDMLLERCEARYAQFNDGSASSSEFIDTRLDEADFRNTNLENTVWTRSSLAAADLTELKNADLRGASLDRIVVSAPDVRGAIVNPTQAMELARLLGLVIR